MACDTGPWPLECNATAHDAVQLFCLDHLPDRSCPYGRGADWECLPAPPSAECVDAAWKKRLAALWADFFGPTALVNVDFDGLLRREPCASCRAGERVAK